MTAKTNCLLFSNFDHDYWLETFITTSSSRLNVQVCPDHDVLAALDRSECLDFIIIDAVSVSDAIQVVTTIRAHRPDLKVIVVTTSPTWKQARRVFYAGATDYVRKSSDKHEILAMIEKAIDEQPT